MTLKEVGHHGQNGGKYEVQNGEKNEVQELQMININSKKCENR